MTRRWMLAVAMKQRVDVNVDVDLHPNNIMRKDTKVYLCCCFLF